MALQYLSDRGASFEWEREFNEYSMRDHVDIDLRNVKMKNVTIALEDDETKLKVEKKLAELKRTLSAGSLPYGEYGFLQAQIDVLSEVLK